MRSIPKPCFTFLLLPPLSFSSLPPSLPYLPPHCPFILTMIQCSSTLLPASRAASRSTCYMHHARSYLSPLWRRNMDYPSPRGKCIICSLKPRLSISDFVSQLWRKIGGLFSKAARQNPESKAWTNSGTKSLGSRLCSHSQPSNSSLFQ